MSLFETNEFEAHEWELPGEVSHSQEMELVNELLEVTTEAELEEFLGKLIRGVAKGAKSLIKSPVFKALGGVLKSVAKTALPMVGSALGSFVAPGIGTVIGGKLGSMASGLLEVQELETMGEEEAELEIARRYVRWASGTVRNAMQPTRGVSPQAAVRSAAIASARQYAPSLLRTTPAGPPAPQRWRQRRRPGYPAPRLLYAQDCTCGGHRAFDGDQYAGTGAPFSGDQNDQGPTDYVPTGAYESEFESESSGELGHEAFETEAFETEAFESHETSGPAQTTGSQTGRWVRRGHRIVVIGV